LFEVSLTVLIVELGIMVKLIVSAIRRKRRFSNYARLSENISQCISEYDHRYRIEPWKRAEIEMLVHDLGNMLALEDDNYLKLSGVVLRRFISFMTPQHEQLFGEKEFLMKLERNILELGQSISNREKKRVVDNILNFCNLTYKYPIFEVDAEESSQLEADVIESCHRLRGKEPYSPYLASKVLDAWSFEKLRQTEPSLILIGTNTRLMLDEPALSSSSFRDRLAGQVERSISYRETDIVRSFDAQSNALAAIMMQKSAWKATKSDRSMIHIFPKNQCELFQIPIIAWAKEKGLREISI
jgi:hypothetical protein